MTSRRYMHLPGNHKRTKFWMKNQIPWGIISPKVAGTTTKWFPSDDEDRYHKAGNKAYGPEDIDYVFNERGYRSMPIDPTSTNKKIMFVGCSFTMGIGLRYEEIWTTQLVDRLKRERGFEIEQHNFGLGGHGSDAFAQIVHQVLPVLKPDLLIVLFTELSRRVIFNEFTYKWAFLTSGCAGDEDAWDGYLRMQYDSHDFYEWVRNFQLIDYAAKANGVPWLWQFILDGIVPQAAYLDYYVDLAGQLPEPFPDFGRVGDYARDNMHAGAASNKEFADMIADYINMSGLI